MEPYRRAMLTFGVLVVLVIGLYGFSDWFSKTTGYVLGEEDKIKLAQCLTGQNSVLYVAENCALCDEQLALFGTQATSFLTLQTCSSIEECPRGAPAWDINGQSHIGVQSLERLGTLSGCVA